MKNLSVLNRKFLSVYNFNINRSYSNQHIIRRDVQFQRWVFSLRQISTLCRHLEFYSSAVALINILLILWGQISVSNCTIWRQHKLYIYNITTICLDSIRILFNFHMFITQTKCHIHVCLKLHSWNYILTVRENVTKKTNKMREYKTSISKYFI